jgi:plastocyanin
MRTAITLLALLIVSSGYFITDSFAEVSENQVFLLEGSGFAVTEEFIKISEIDLGLSSQDQRGSTINFLTENGFIILGDEEFVISNLQGKFLREGKYIRINGNIESSNGFDTTISFFGRLVDESKDASVYGFTGRITTSDNTYKVIYTTKLSSLSKINIISNESQNSNNLSIHILKDSSTQGIGHNEVPGQQSSNPLTFRFFSQDRISVEPGTTITIINDDVVSHKIISGKENYGDRHNPFTPDGRISTETFASGESINITFDDAGFYRLYSPDYPWMKIVAYVFSESDSIILGEGQNYGN